jgi:hypothetical protein
MVLYHAAAKWGKVTCTTLPMRVKSHRNRQPQACGVRTARCTQSSQSPTAATPHCNRNLLQLQVNSVPIHNHIPLSLRCSQ